jgi:hopanoid biosynthesis associated RND transporter like protein HpnN
MLESFGRGVGRWVEFVRARALLVLTVSLSLAVLSGWYSATDLTINTSNDKMLSEELPFQRDSLLYDQAFPHLIGNIVVVIDGHNSDRVDIAADRLAEALRRNNGPFESVFDPEGLDYFRRNGLLFLDEGELAGLVDRLTESQAFLGTLWRDPSLRGLFGVLDLAVRNSEDGSGDIGPLVRTVAETVTARTSGTPRPVSWRDLIEGKQSSGHRARRIILVKPRIDETSLQPAAEAIDVIRRLAKRVTSDEAEDIRVRLTGSAALEEEELESVAEGMGLAGLVSATLVLVLLFWCFRSGRLVAAMLLTLLVGLIWTAGLATLTVGRLNLISVAFAVLFVGLSVDFGIHFALRLRESIDSGEPFRLAFPGAGRSVGGALVLCAVAAAISFYSFLPTDYVGLAELGVIAGNGMFVALLANLTVLPALIAAMPPSARPKADEAVAVERANFMTRNARPIVWGALALAAASTFLMPSARFDFDPLNLRDPDTESVSTLLDLMNEEAGGPYSIDVLSRSEAQARAMASRLEELETVRSVISADRFLPAGQEEKLAILEEAAFLVLPSLSGERLPAPDGAARLKALERLRLALLSARSSEFSALSTALDGFKATPKALAALERDLLGTLPYRLLLLKQAFEAQPVTAEDIPATLRGRYRAADGTVRIEVFPREDVRDPSAMRRFVASVQSVAPRATGSPVIIVEAGRAIMRSFAEAGAISVAAIAFLVWVILRRLRDVAMVFAPLILAAMLTVAVAAVAGLPFNFANVIVLPLLFGLGVASAIHLVLRERARNGVTGLFETSTPRAVVFSALTTVGSFASIALSSHPGTASMGVLLALAISLSLFCTLVFLPALMAYRRNLKD